MIKVFHLVIDLLSADRLPIQNVRDHFDQLFRVDRFYQVEIKASLDGHFFVLGQTVTSHRNQRQRLSARFSICFATSNPLQSGSPISTTHTSG